MFCKQCGTQNIDTAKFCKNCGASLNGAATQEEPAANVEAVITAAVAEAIETKKEETKQESTEAAATDTAAAPSSQKGKHNAEHMLNMLRKNKEATGTEEIEEKEPVIQKEKKNREKKPNAPDVRNFLKTLKEKTPKEPKEPKAPKEKTAKAPKVPKEKIAKEPKLPKEKKVKEPKTPKDQAAKEPKEKKEKHIGLKLKKGEAKAPKKEKPPKEIKIKEKRRLPLPKVSPKTLIIIGATLVVLLLIGTAVFIFAMGGIKPAVKTVETIHNTVEEVQETSEASGVVLENATLATKVDPKTAKPVDKVSTFLVGATELYATVYVKGVSEATSVSAIWTYKSSSLVFSKTAIAIEKDEQIQFNVTVPGGIPRGDYIVDFQVNGKSKSNLSFTVI
jgi:hypothetical protein